MIVMCLCTVAIMVLIVIVVLALSRLGHIYTNGLWQKVRSTFSGDSLQSQKLQSCRTHDQTYEMSIPEQGTDEKLTKTYLCPDPQGDQTLHNVIFANFPSCCNKNNEDTMSGDNCRQRVREETPSQGVELVVPQNISRYTTDIDRNRVSVERRPSCDVSKNEKATRDSWSSDMSLADKFFDRHNEESESVSRTVTDMRSLVSHSSNVHVLNVGPNSVVNYTAKEKDEDVPCTSEERLLPVLCVVQKPEGPVYSARKRTHEPDTDTDCRVLLGVKCDVNSKELMALSFSHSLSKGIVGTDLNDPSRNYLIDIDTITNVSTETQSKHSPSCQYWPLIPDPQERTLPRSVCGFWLQFFGPSTIFELCFCLRVAHIQQPGFNTNLKNPHELDYRTIQIVDQADICVETRNVRRRRQITASESKKIRYSRVADEESTEICLPSKNKSLLKSQPSVEMEKHTGMPVLPSLSRSRRSGEMSLL